MEWLVYVLSVIVWIAGCFYILRPTHVTAMAGVEPPQRNTVRRRLRRCNGVVMLGLALLLFRAGLLTAPNPPDRRAIAAWFWVLCVLLLVVIFAGIDLILTRRSYLRRRKGN